MHDLLRIFDSTGWQHEWSDEPSNGSDLSRFALKLVLLVLAFGAAVIGLFFAVV